MALDKKNLVIRALSGFVYVALIIGAVILGGIASSILFTVFAVMGSCELEKAYLSQSNPSNWLAIWCFDALLMICLLIAPYLTSGFSILIFIPLLFIRFIIQLFIRQRYPLKSIATTIFALIYIGIPLAIVIFAVGLCSNPWKIVCILAMIWINDTGAYLTGSSFGRHKMFPRLSPKKSWEGFFGGMLFNIAAAFVFYYCFDLHGEFLIRSVGAWIFIGVNVTVWATFGDLFESLLKRSLGIKDFGNIIPGHGGILDRIDSLLCVAPGLLITLPLLLLFY